jgi:DNA polymerase-1
VSVVAVDTETWLIEPGLLAPPLVCLQWQVGPEPQLVHRADARPNIARFLASDAVMVGHNVAFDMAVIAAQWPDLLPLIIDKYNRDQVTDTLLREQLIMIARGQFRRYFDQQSGEVVAVKYSLTDCCHRHFGAHLKKEGFRLFYRAFDEHPDVSTWDRVAAQFQEAVRAGRPPEWFTDYAHNGILSQKDIDGLLAAAPEEARTYALEDARTTLRLYESQDRVAKQLWPTRNTFADQFRKARTAFAAHLASCWGVHTNGPAVEELAAKLHLEFNSLQSELQGWGLIREDGTADTKAAMAMMERACIEEGLPVARTKGGAVSLSSESCGRFEDTDDQGSAAHVIGQYSAYLTLRKTLANDVKMLQRGVEVPLQPTYRLLDTGRWGASKPNVQAINKGAGIRECITPREGMTFIQADYPSLELHTLAQWCLSHPEIRWSRLADIINAGRDVHLEVAAAMLGITYEEALARRKEPEVKAARQASKAVNYGLPGGLGAAKLARYARVSYGVDMSEAEAARHKFTWQKTFPETVPFFAIASRATAGGDGEEEHLFTGRWRGGCRYSALCNGRFQGLGADCATEAFWRVTRACYAEPGSPLYGARPVLFVHDELILEIERERCDAGARELSRLMAEGANVYVPDVPFFALGEGPEVSQIVPLAMDLWSKGADTTYDDQGRIVPWAPKAEAA